MPFLLLAAIVAAFFYKTLVFGRVPFPGDLLLNHYAPWSSSSYFGYNPGGVPSKDQYFDTIRELYPWKTEVVRQLKQGQLPLWNPYNFSGAPLLANYQSQVFYPPAVLYLVLPQIAAWTILIILQPLLGSVFLYLYATEIGIGTTGALLTAVIFNFGSFANVWLEFNTVWHTILWIPLLLFLVERAVRNRNVTAGHLAVFAGALFASMTAGHPQDFLNGLIFTVIYSGIRLATAGIPKQTKTTLLLRFGSAGVLTFGLAAPQLLPTITLFRQSARVPHDLQFILDTMLVQPWQMPMMVIQDWFGNPATRSYFAGDTYVANTLSAGVVGFLLAAIGVVSAKKHWHVRMHAAVTAVILLLTVHTPLSRLIYAYPIPILGTGSPTRITFLLILSLAVLAGFGFDALSAKPARKRFIVAAVATFATLWCLYGIYPRLPFIPHPDGSARTTFRALILGTVIAAAAVTAVIASGKFRLLRMALIVLSVAELGYAFLKFNPFVPPAYIFPENTVFTYLRQHAGIDRFWGYGTAAIDADFATQYGIYDPDGTDPLNPAAYNRLLQLSKDGTFPTTFTRQTRSDAYIAGGYGETDLPDNPYRLKILDTLGVRYVLDRDENPKNDRTFPPVRFTPVWSDQGWTVYRNNLAAERIFATGDIIPYTTDTDFAGKFTSEDFDPHTSILVNAADMAVFSGATSGSASIRNITYTPEQISLDITADTTQALFVSDTYDIGWQATVDGTAVPVIRADYALRALPVPAGSHRVIMSYHPQSFTTGIRVACVSVLLLAGYLIMVAGMDIGKKKQSAGRV